MKNPDVWPFAWAFPFCLLTVLPPAAATEELGETFRTYDWGLEVRFPTSFSVGGHHDPPSVRARREGRDPGARARELRRSEFVFVEDEVLGEYRERPDALPGASLASIPTGEMPVLSMTRVIGPAALELRSRGRAIVGEEGRPAVVMHRIGGHEVERWPGQEAPGGEGIHRYVVTAGPDDCVTFTGHRRHWHGPRAGRPTGYDVLIERMIESLTITAPLAVPAGA